MPGFALRALGSAAASLPFYWSKIGDGERPLFSGF